MKLRPILSMAIAALSLLFAIMYHPVIGAAFLFVAGNLLTAPQMDGRLCATLTSTEILMDVIKAFKKSVPGLHRMGTDFQPKELKLNQQYIAHIPSMPTVEDVTTTYAVTGQTGRSLLTDVAITVDKRKGVLIKWEELYAIQDQKNRYAEVIGLAGFALAKNFIDDLLSGVNARNFSQASVFAEADCDYDMLTDVCGDMNGVGAFPTGRIMLVNTPVANTLGGDSRIISKDYYGQQPDGNALRRFRGVGGFSEVLEYADFPLNNGTALTGATAEADDDLVTKAAHGLVTGDRVVLTAITGGTGLTQGSVYYVIRVSSSTFKLASTQALAAAGTGIDITVDGTSITITPTENLVAFGFDMRAFAVLAGIPDGFGQAELRAQLNIPANMNFESVTEPETGITMGAVSWQDVGTGNLNWMPVLVWGKALGRQAGDVAAGTKCDYAGHRVVKA